MTQTLEHKVFTAEPVTTDQGIFEALVSTPTEDREGDVVKSGAFAATIADWNSSGKTIPLAWDHGTDPEDIVGWIDPARMREGKAGLIVGGKVDLEGERGRQVWKLLKSGSLGFSFGYLVTDSVERPGGGREIRGVDLFEISATSTPMNSGTRVLSTKSSNDSEDIRQQARDAMLACLRGATPKRPDEMSLAELKAYGKELTRDIRPPITIHTFEIE